MEEPAAKKAETDTLWILCKGVAQPSGTSVGDATNVDQLKKKIKSEFSKALKDVDAAALMIYKSKAMFDGKDDSENEGKPEYQALEVDMKIENIEGGGTAKTALYVDYDDPVGERAVVGLEDMQAIAVTHMQKKFQTWPTWNPGDASETLQSSCKKDIKERVGITCVVCGGAGGTLAHLLKTRALCKKFHVNWTGNNDDSNWLILCGTEGEKGTCHDLVDKFKMSFLHVKGERERKHWRVIGGGKPHHGKEIEIVSKPHRRVVHGHLTHCMTLQSLDIPTDYADDDLPKPELASGSPSATSQASQSDEDEGQSKSKGKGDKTKGKGQSKGKGDKSKGKSKDQGNKGKGKSMGKGDKFKGKSKERQPSGL